MKKQIIVSYGLGLIIMSIVTTLLNSSWSNVFIEVLTWAHFPFWVLAWVASDLMTGINVMGFNSTVFAEAVFTIIFCLVGALVWGTLIFWGMMIWSDARE